MAKAIWAILLWPRIISIGGQCESGGKRIGKRVGSSPVERSAASQPLPPPAIRQQRLSRRVHKTVKLTPKFAGTLHQKTRDFPPQGKTSRPHRPCQFDGKIYEIILEIYTQPLPGCVGAGVTRRGRHAAARQFFAVRPIASNPCSHARTRCGAGGRVRLWGREVWSLRRN
jgi:hypothetical protein